MAHKLIVTHNGTFHPDDCLAVSVIKVIEERKGNTVEIVRSRKDADWARGDYVVDVGRVYDPDNNRFDHHQEGGAGERENGIKYSSLGIVWRKYGVEFCDGSEEIARKIDKKIVEPTDALDNGQEVVVSKYEDIYPYTLYDIIDLYRPAWHEKDKTFDQGFFEAMAFAEHFLLREVQMERARIVARERVHQLLEGRADKRLLVIDEYLPVHPDIYEKEKELLFVIMPTDGGTWALKTVRVNPYEYKARKDLPSAWAGKERKELQVITGVPDAEFCHSGRFIAVAHSKDGALALAKLALGNEN
ncbi:MAG TPA: MYG1 family protein [Candidatus Paceibacterota bacterium]